MKEKKLTDEELNKLIAGLDYQSWAQNLPELSQAAYMLKYQKAEIERLTEEIERQKDAKFRAVLDKYELRKINAELQKQVDELKEEKLSAVCDLNMRIVELDNELKQAKSLLSFTESLLEFREETIKYLEDANIRYAEALENKVKDTAKEIEDKIQELLNTPFEGKTEKQEYQRKGMEEGLKMALEIVRECKGVEVE
jgi:hypothetical protein